MTTFTLDDQTIPFSHFEMHMALRNGNSEEARRHAHNDTMCMKRLACCLFTFFLRNPKESHGVVGRVLASFKKDQRDWMIQAIMEHLLESIPAPGNMIEWRERQEYVLSKIPQPRQELLGLIFLIETFHPQLRWEILTCLLCSELRKTGQVEYPLTRGWEEREGATTCPLVRGWEERNSATRYPLVRGWEERDEMSSVRIRSYPKLIDHLMECSFSDGTIVARNLGVISDKVKEDIRCLPYEKGRIDQDDIYFYHPDICSGVVNSSAEAICNGIVASTGLYCIYQIEPSLSPSSIMKYAVCGFVSCLSLGLVKYAFSREEKAPYLGRWRQSEASW